MDCLFCKFVSGEFKTDKVYEDEDFIIIRDIEPKAKNHFLAIPKRHFKYLAEMTEEEIAAIAKAKEEAVVLSDEELNKTSYTGSKHGTGGITTKLLAADFLMKKGKDMFLASGFDLKVAREFLLNSNQIGGTIFKGKR